MTIWTNADGLRVKFARDMVVSGQGGEYATSGPQRLTEVTVDYTDIGSSSAVVDEHIFVPAGARIEKVEFVTETAFTSGGSATLDIGLVRTSDYSTAIDADGLVAAAALSTINAAGETNTYIIGATGVGALVGTTLANEGSVVVNYGTAAFTAGKGRLVIEYIEV